MNELFAQLPDLLAGHLGLALSALALGTLLSVPLGILAHRLPAFGAPVLGFTGLVQTVPSMALLALMVPLFGGMIGFWPAFAALTLYSMLPTLRNTATGLEGIDPTLREAARGLGMTPRQSLWQVELPLALPVMMAGLRTASVWVVGTATLATPVGAQSLGGYIFSGLQTRNWLAVIFGCIFAAGLAMLMDAIIAQGEKAAAERSRRRFTVALSGFVALLVVGFGPLLVPNQSAVTMTDAPQQTGAPAFEGPVQIGAKSFTEQYILADLIADTLNAQGIAAETTANMGSTILFDALTQNQVDIYVGYTGTIWATLMNRETQVPRHQMAIEVAHYLWAEHGVLTLGNLGFENAYGFAMRADKAEALGLKTIGDLSALGADISIGGDPEFFARPEWIKVRDAYGLQGAKTRSMDSTFMYGAARDGAVDVITAYTTDGRIDAFNLTVLEDPKGAFPPYDAILMLGPAAAAQPDIVKALSGLVHAIDAKAMRKANGMVDLESKTPQEAAAALTKQLNP